MWNGVHSCTKCRTEQKLLQAYHPVSLLCQSGQGCRVIQCTMKLHPTRRLCGKCAGNLAKYPGENCILEQAALGQSLCREGQHRHSPKLHFRWGLPSPAGIIIYIYTCTQDIIYINIDRILATIIGGYLAHRFLRLVLTIATMTDTGTRKARRQIKCLG